MSDEKKKTMPEVSQSKKQRRVNPAVMKAVAERVAQERKEADKNAVKDRQEAGDGDNGRRHRESNRAILEALQQTAEKASDRSPSAVAPQERQVVQAGQAPQEMQEDQRIHTAQEDAREETKDPREPLEEYVKHQDGQEPIEAAPIEKEQAVEDKVPETADIGEQEQATETKDPPIEDREPIVDPKEPAAEPEEPIAESKEPIIEAERPTKENRGKEDAASQGQAQADKANTKTRVQKQKKRHDGEPFHKDSQKKEPDKEKPKGLFVRIRDFAIKVYHRVRHAVERAIGRGRIPTMPIVNKADISRSAIDLSGKDKPSEDRTTQEKTNDREKGRNWGELFYHGFARRLLGKDAYMHAIQQSDKQEAPRQVKNVQEQEKPIPAQKDTNGKDGKGLAGKADAPVSRERPERPSKDVHERGSQEKQEALKKEPEEMKRKFNSLHKIITDELEDRFSNAKEAKEAYIMHYAELLQKKLTEMNHGEPVQVLAARKDGKLEIRINDEPEQYGGYPSFMGCTKIRVEIDGHLTITSAEAFVPTRQTDDGKFVGRNVDISDTLGAYIVSDLAKNFREDYNRGLESYNLTSRNEFEKTMMAAAEQGRSGFAIDNINYSISVNDGQIQVSRDGGDKAFTIAMDAGTKEIKAAKEAYEAKAEKLHETEKKLETAMESYKELAEKYGQQQNAYKQADAKVVAAKQKHKEASIELTSVQKQLSGKYPGVEKMDELRVQERKAMGARNESYKESKDANIEKNVAQAEMDKIDKEIKLVREQIVALEHEAAPLRDACKGAKIQYDSASLEQKDSIRELYQEHTRDVMRDRESTIHAFEEILPECKNNIGGNFGLEDLDRIMEETGRTSMEKALSGQARDGQEMPSIGEGRIDGLESPEISAERD